MTTLFQPELVHDEGVGDAEVARLREWLSDHGWQTRRQLVQSLGWTERKVRAVAELMFDEIIRGQLGFKLTNQITRDDLPVALQAAQAAISEGKGRIRYGLALKKRLHEVIA